MFKQASYLVPCCALALAAHAQSPAAPTARLADEAEKTVKLDPFTVTAEQEQGYLAGNAISGTKTNTALRDLPISLSVITSEMLSDLNATLPSDALLYSPSVDLTNTGTGGNIQGSPFTTGTTNVRGSGTFFVLRDGFRTYGEPAGVGVQRVEVIKGPAAVLYGITKPGGIVNYLTKTPTYGRNFARGTFSYGSYDSTRSTLDVNYGSLLDGRLAVRLNGSYNDLSTWFRFSRSRELAFLPSVSYKPFERTEVMFQYEYTERVLPPNSSDYLTRPVTGFRGSSVPFFIYPEGTADPVAALTPQLPVGFTPDFTFRGYGSKTRVPYKTGIVNVTQGVGDDLSLNLQVSRSRRNNFRQAFTPTAQFTGGATATDAGNPISGTTIMPAPRIRKQYEQRDGMNEIDNINLTAIYQKTITLPLIGEVENKFILGLTEMVDEFEEYRVHQFLPGTNTRMSYYYSISPTMFTGLPAEFPNSVELPRPLPGQALSFTGVPGEFRLSAAAGDSAVEKNKFRTGYVAWSGRMFQDRFLFNAGVVRAIASQDRTTGNVAPFASTRAEYEQNSPLVGAIFRPMKWASFYVQASKSFNPNTAARDGFDNPLPAEQGQGEEIGLKLDPWEGRLTANLAAYSTVESNRFITDPNAPNRNSFFLDANGVPQPISGPNDPRYNPNTPGQIKGAGVAVGEAKTDGFETEVIWSPNRDFQIFAGYSYLDGRISKDTGNTLATLIGRPLPGNYYHRVTALAKYKFNRGPLRGLDVVLGSNWRSELFRDVINSTDNSTSTIISPVFRYGKPSWDGDFKLGYQTKIFNRKTSFQLNVRNLYGREVAVGWKPTTERSYSFEQYYFRIPPSYTFRIDFEL